ncbi:MAG: hypothetical protein F4220_06460 [Gammaproteobacteria bacterium]|nr:hypothetical protein [Gammaproteobacteria bacterium]
MAVQALYVAALAAFVLSFPASAQVAVPEEPGHCSGAIESADPTKPTNWPTPKAFKVQGSGVCSEYSYSGWDRSLDLYLGEGARDYLPLIIQAVATWNDTLRGFSQKDVIRVSGRRPNTYYLSENFWQHSITESTANLYDGQSVIYFKSSGAFGKTGSYAHLQWSDYSGQMTHADIYINTTHEEKYGRNLARAVKIDRLNETYEVWAFANATYLTILHELGHALGLKHLPVSGNIMSYNYMPKLGDIWRVPLGMFSTQMSVLTQTEPSTEIYPFLRKEGEFSPYMILKDPATLGFLEAFTSSVELGEQDKMALMCVYDFEDWNH